jgi:hypothetical protein
MAALLARFLAFLRTVLVEHLAEWRDRLARAWRGAWERRPTVRRAGARLIVLAVGLTGVAAIAARWQLATALPSSLDWQALGALLGRSARAGDVVILSPPWLERAREVAPPGLPVLAPRTLAGERLPGVRRAWLVMAPDLPATRWDVALELERRAARAVPERLGALAVTAYELADPAPPAPDLTDLLLGRALVHDRNGLPRRCLPLRVEGGDPTSLTLPEVPLGRALAGEVTRLSGGGAAQLAVQVDGAEVAVVALPGGATRAPLSADTSRAMGRHAVALVARSVEPPATLCVEARVEP